MLTPEQLQNLPQDLTDLYEQLSEFILRDIARRIAKGAEITDSVIMPDVVIENGAVIRSAIIAEGCHIKAGARVGDYVEGEERKISVIGKDKIIAEGTVIDAGAIV